jgi:hypothetical protein
MFFQKDINEEGTGYNSDVIDWNNDKINKDIE